MGFHIEGPFLSSKPGFCGAHNPAFMQNPTPEHLLELRKLAREIPVLLTIAPEWPAAREAIARARFYGFQTNLGHTDATQAQLAAAVKEGARWFTHLGNGCPQTLDRHDNILWRALDLHSLHVSLIPDGHHVSPELFRLIHRIKGDDIYYTTDAMSAAGAGPGKYRLGKLELEVQADGIVRLPGATNFAGSSLTPIAGVFKAATMLNRSWQHMWKFFSTKPAYRMCMKMGMRLNYVDSLAVGEAAEFCILEFPDPKKHSLDQLQLKTVVPFSTT
jgi:N-acetylglucosamine-6-phosphate deacetylase